MQLHHSRLHGFVFRAAGRFGDGPADVVKRAFPLAGFAVQAVGRIGGLDLLVDHFIDACRAERNAGRAELRGAFVHADRWRPESVRWQGCSSR